MKKLFILFIALIGFNANAGLINIVVDETEVSVGETVSVSLIASGFDAFDSFDFDFNFNTDVFAFDALSLQSDLPLDDGMFTLGLLATEMSDHIALSFFDLVPFAGGDFLLAKFELTASSAGLSNFSLANAEFYNFFDTVNVDTSARAQTSILADAQIPVPATWMLALLPALLLLSKRRNTH